MKKLLLFLLLAIMLVLTACQSDIKNGLVVPSWLVGEWENKSYPGKLVNLTSDDVSFDNGSGYQSIKQNFKDIKTLRSDDNFFEFKFTSGDDTVKYTFEKISPEEVKVRENDGKPNTFQRKIINQQ